MAMAPVLLRQGDEIPKAEAVLDVFCPTDNALYSIAFGTHTIPPEPIEMPLGMISGLVPLSDNPRRKRGNF